METSPSQKLEAINRQLAEEYEALKVTYKENAQKAKLRLLSKEFECMQKNKGEFAWNLYQVYSNLAFFPDKQVVDAFKRLGFKQNTLKWLVNLADIEKEFNAIEESGLFILRANALRIIWLYLDSKIRNAVQIETGFFVKHDDRSWNTLTKQIYEVSRRVSYAEKKGKEIEDEFTLLMKGVMDEIHQTGITEGKRKSLTDLTQGKTERMFMTVLWESIADIEEKYGNTGIKNATYNLFKLICQDTNWEEDKIIGTTRSKILTKLVYKK